MKSHFKFFTSFFLLVALSLSFYSCPNPGEVTVKTKLCIYFTENANPATSQPDLTLPLKVTSLNKVTAFDIIKYADETNNKLYTNFMMTDYGPFLTGIAYVEKRGGAAPVWGDDPDNPTSLGDADKYYYGYTSGPYWGLYFGSDLENLEFSPVGCGELEIKENQIVVLIASKYVAP